MIFNKYIAIIHQTSAYQWVIKG